MAQVLDKRPTGRKSRTNGYMVFAADIRKINEGSFMACTEMMKLAGAEWSKLDPGQKETYN